MNFERFPGRLEPELRVSESRRTEPTQGVVRDPDTLLRKPPQVHSAFPVAILIVADRNGVDSLRDPWKHRRSGHALQQRANATQRSRPVPREALRTCKQKSKKVPITVPKPRDADLYQTR